MPRADFYLIAKPRFLSEPLRLVCELARKANDANLSMLILARDAGQAEELDDLLWSFDPDAYVPHQIAGSDEDEDETPVLIATPDTDVA
ncbi:MAG TPA: DNA polymerase III subunit chi, partial [Stenotrophomonas sp.]